MIKVRVLQLLLRIKMINKVVGYGGYRSYSQCPYPTLKQGKQLEITNQVWSSTKREADKINPLHNYNHYHTLYKNNHAENTQPQDYHPQNVVKGGNSSINFAGSSLVKPYDAVEAEKDGQPEYRNAFKLLKTGTEHWKSNYQGSVCDPAKQQKIEGKSQLRAHSCKRPGMANQQLAKVMSYKNRPYINNVKTGMTDYAFNYGDKVGSNPKDILNQASKTQPTRDDPLKYGTNQLWTEIPGYMGFKPAQVPFGQLKSKMEERRIQDRGNKKLQLGENYHVNIPGYGGHKPTANLSNTKIRESCFDFKN